MRTHDDSAAATPVRWRGDLLLLTLIFGVLYLFAASRLTLLNPDEPRYAGIAREMIATGDWVTPRLNDTRYFEKPPLVPWLVALSRLAFGPGETAARLPVVIFGVGGVLLAYALGRRLFGREAGLAAAVVLGTSLLYFALSWVLLLDMVLAGTLSAALICFLLGVREPPGPRRRALFLALYASAALATLAKGLIGFLLPGAIMFLWLLLLNQWHRLRPLYLPTGCVGFLLIAAPWHVLVAQRNPEWASFYFGHEHWARFTSTVHGRAEPFWYFVPVLVLGLFPWIGFLPSAVRAAVAGGWARRKEQADAWFLVLWAAFVFLFFSRSQSKLIPYLLPALPPLAVLIGAWLARNWAEGAASRLRAGLGVFSFVCGLLGVAFLAAVFRPGIVRDAEQMMALRPFGIAMAVVLFLGGVAAPWAAKRRGVASGVGTVVGTMIGFFLVAMVAGPGWQRANTKDLALVARERIAPGERVYHYWGFFHDFVYYAERPVGLVNYTDELEVQFLAPAVKAERFIDDAELRRQWAGSARVWLVVRKRSQSAPESVFADPTFRHHVIADSRTHQLVSNRP